MSHFTLQNTVVVVLTSDASYCVEAFEACRVIQDDVHEARIISTIISELEQQNVAAVD